MSRASRAGRPQCQGRTAVLHHRPGRGVAGADVDLHRGRHARRRGDGHADLCFVAAAAARNRRRAMDGLPSSSRSRPYRSAPATRSSGSSPTTRHRRRFCSGLQSRIPARRRRDRRFQAARPHRDRGRRGSARAAVMREVYRPLFLNKSPILFMDRRTAELIKYAANAFLATKITFINEMADLCEKVGANVQDVARGHRARQPHRQQVPPCRARLWRRCFPKDTLALLKTAEDYEAPQADRRSGGRSQREPQARDGPQGDRGDRRHDVRAAR